MFGGFGGAAGFFFLLVELGVLRGFVCHGDFVGDSFLGWKVKRAGCRLEVGMEKSGFCDFEEVPRVGRSGSMNSANANYRAQGEVYTSASNCKK